MPATPTLVPPAHHTAPSYTVTLGPEVTGICREANFDPDPEQELLLNDVFALDDSGRSAAFEVGVVAARQNLKTGLFKQCALGWLYVLELDLIVWSAHEFNTAREAFRDMVNLIDGCHYLSRRVKKIWSGSGNESIELITGERLIFKARTKTGGRGLTGDRVVLDEAFALTPDHMGALLPTMSAVPDPQVVYGSSAGLATSDVLRAIRDRGRAGTSSRLAYAEWCAPEGGCADEECKHTLDTPGCALDDVERWRMANPLLGRRRKNGTGLTVEHIRAEREAMAADPHEFARERLGWWDESGAAEVFGPGKWEACGVQGRPDGLRVGALGIAVSFDLAHAAIVAAARDGDEIYVKPLRHGPGTAWVVEAARQLQLQHGGIEVVIDGGGPAASLIPALKKHDVELIEASTGDVLDACAEFFKAVVDGNLRHGDFEELNKAAAGVVKRDVGDRWAWGRKKSTSDISPLEAATLAAWHAERADLDPFFAFG